MRTIKAGKANEEEMRAYGKFIRLPDSESFRGDGWECWMTEQVCIGHAAKIAFGRAEEKGSGQVTAMRCSEGSGLLVLCGEKEIILTLAEDSGNHTPEINKAQAFLLKPGDLFSMDPFVWYEIRGIQEEACYYMLGSDDGFKERNKVSELELLLER